MRTFVLFGLASLLWLQSPGAPAEILHFEYSQHAKLKQVMSTEGGRAPPVYTQNRAPTYVLTRYVIEGTSAEEWTEVIDVMNTNRKAEPKTLGAWYERFREQDEKTCPGEWTVIAETADSLTFERKTPECAPHPAQHALYKVLYGKRDAFTVTCTRKGTMTSEDRAGWLGFLEKVYLSEKF